jgi:ribosome maturation factor RimP
MLQTTGRPQSLPGAQVDDLYGSPTLDDVEQFSRQFYKGLEEAVGEETAWKLTVEVSSPVRICRACRCNNASCLPQAHH